MATRQAIENGLGVIYPQIFTHVSRLGCNVIGLVAVEYLAGERLRENFGVRVCSELDLFVDSLLWSQSGSLYQRPSSRGIFSGQRSIKSARGIL